MKIQQWSNT